ncbi:MAG: diaminopimelate decarboxylase [Legionellales bacterium]|nr:diaminopimelate decarboxylase [Legionellales bacterium]
MDHFIYRDNELYVEDMPLQELAERFGTPLYVYSHATLMRHIQVFREALKDYPHLICYAVKANSNLAILQRFAQQGLGFDVVSGGELHRVLTIGGDPNKIVFSGVGKTRAEIEYGLQNHIHCFNVESIAELQRLADIGAQYSRAVPIALRINPNVDAKTHPHISTGLTENKFGIPIEEAFSLCQDIVNHQYLQLIGLSAHIGSQITTLDPFLKSVEQLINLYRHCQDHNITLKHLDVGGGLGVRYQQETPPSPQEYIEALMNLMGKERIPLIFEPGRVLIANAGILLTKVEYIKKNSQKHFAIVDAAMNDLMRPALYDAYHEIIPVKLNSGLLEFYDIVGPVCETSDFLGKNRHLNIAAGDLLAIRSCGAYGSSMSSQYNSRLRPAEILVNGSDYRVIRQRDNLDDLYRNEHV